MDQHAEPHAIFDNDLLLDKIIGYVIPDKTKAGKKNIGTCRLINKVWLQSVSRVLRKSREPLFPIFLEPGYFSFGSKYHSKWNKKPDEILRAAMGCHQKDDPVPPYSISTSRTFMPDHRLLDCLTNCGSSLVQLKLSLLADSVPKPVTDNVFLLPRLKSFEVKYFQESSYDNSDGEDRRIDYTQHILDASANLKSLLIYCSFDNRQLPDYASHLKLPASITELNFDCVMNNCTLEILAKNWMPNLKTLKFLVNKAPFQTELMGRILANVRKTLKTLHVGETSPRIVNKSLTTFQFPVMEKLETIHIETAYFALGEMLPPLSKFAPVLRHMVLNKQTLSMFRKWTNNSDFQFVESLTVSLVTGEHDNNGLQHLDTTRPLNFDLNTMEMLKRAFPNLLQLDITISAAEPTALVFIMEEMKNLRHLCIRTLASPHVSSSVVWDSLLIGVPEERMVELTKSPKLWKEMQSLYSELPSIRNLNDLQTLELVGPNTRVTENYPIISKVSFHFAFLQMPNLSKFIWSRLFYPGKWGDDDRLSRPYNLDNRRKLRLSD